MIVVDVNVIAYALIAGPHTNLARQLLLKQPVVRVPALWIHEFTNVLTVYHQQQLITERQANQLLSQAWNTFGPMTQPVDPLNVLHTAIRHRISAYDAEYLTLAIVQSTRCITEDRALRKAAPDLTLSMAQFLAPPS